MRSFEGAIAAVQRRVRRLRPPDHRARPTMRRGFFPSKRGERRVSFAAGHENRSKASSRLIHSRFVLAVGARLATNLTTFGTFGNRNDEANACVRRIFGRPPVSSYHQASSRDDKRAFRRLASSSFNRVESNQINPRSPPSLRSSSRLPIRRAPPLRRPVPRRTGPRPPTRAGTRIPRRLP